MGTWNFTGLMMFEQPSHVKVYGGAGQGYRRKPSTRGWKGS